MRVPVEAQEDDFGSRTPLNRAEKADLESELTEVINHREDQVIFVVLGPAEGRGDRVITALGVPYLKMEAPCYAF